MISLQSERARTSAEEVALDRHGDIVECLSKSSFAQIRRLICECRGTVVVLRGRVDTYFITQTAQELVRRIDRSLTIANLVIVEDADAGSTE